MKFGVVYLINCVSIKLIGGVLIMRYVSSI
jgi:hypothetical protein